MFKQGIQSERVLDGLLHAGGVLGLASLLLCAYWLTVDPVQESLPACPGLGSATAAARLHAVHAQLAELESQLKAADSRIQEGSRRIPPEPREGEFVKDILQIAKKAGLTIRDYQTTPPITRDGCRQLPIHLSGSADYCSICRFLDGVNHLPRLVTVERLEISAGSTANAYPIAVTVAVYFTGPVSAVVNSGVRKNG